MRNVSETISERIYPVRTSRWKFQECGGDSFNLVNDVPICARSLVLGAPAKVARELSDEAIAKMHAGTESYVKRQQMYKARLKRMD